MEWQPYRLRGRGAVATAPTLGKALYGEVFPCAYCHGTGTQLHMRSKCPVCGGTGSNKVGSPAVTCAMCRGKGESPPRSHLTCAACHGKGFIHVKEPFESCDLCRGVGRVGGTQLPCRKCRGAGVAPVGA